MSLGVPAFVRAGCACWPGAVHHAEDWCGKGSSTAGGGRGGRRGRNGAALHPRKHPVLYQELLNVFNACTMLHLTPDPNCVLTCIKRKVTSIVLCRSTAHVSAIMNWLLEQVASQTMTEGNVLSPAPSQSDLGTPVKATDAGAQPEESSKKPKTDKKAKKDQEENNDDDDEEADSSSSTPESED